MLIVLVKKISPYGRNDNKMNCDTVSKAGIKNWPRCRIKSGMTFDMFNPE